MGGCREDSAVTRLIGSGLDLFSHSIELPVALELLDETGQVRGSQLPLELPR
jgi:hypothetical protein